MVLGYLGIDESNHGRYPEIFVGVYSTITKDKRKSEFSKIRRKIRSIKKEISDNGLKRDYRFVSIPEEYSEYLTRDQLALVAMSELIVFHDIPSNVCGSTLDTVLIDGNRACSEVDKIKEIIYPHKPKINCVPKGDKLYRVVNLADLTANALFREYSSTNPQKTLDDCFEDKQLIPKLDEFLAFFRQDRKIY